MAMILLILPIIRFTQDLIIQSQALLDGPLAHYSSYTFSLNNIVIAILLALILLFDMKFKVSHFGVLSFRFLGFTAFIVSFIGLIYLVKHSLFYGNFQNLELIYIGLYLRQTAYLLTAIIIIGQSYKAKWSYINYGERHDS